MPTVEPAGNASVTPSSTFASASLRYLKETSLNSTEPSGTATIPRSGLSMAGTSRSTSPTRWMLVRARVMSKNTLEIIMREFVICST